MTAYGGGGGIGGPSRYGGYIGGNGGRGPGMGVVWELCSMHASKH